jgi:hypothetical protein
MTFGLSAEQAKGIILTKDATYGVADLMAVGFPAELAKYIADFAAAAPTVEGLAALGMHPLLAVDVEAIINA